MKQNPLQHPQAFANALAAWFAAHGRDYPWRRTQDPYAVLVSEVMLQQTQIPTVLDRGYYTRWMLLFPTFAALAQAPESEVLKAWEGLGYYRRARNLQKLAQAIMADHAGIFPRNMAVIRALPGIGPYTAGAVASFAFDEAEAIVDGNIARVLSRLFDDATPVDSSSGQKLLWQRAELLVKAAASARVHNSALMELGQTICKPTPNCAACPVSDFCTATNPSSLPVKDKKATVTAVIERVLFHQSDDGVLLEQETGARRTGLWKLPMLNDDSTAPVLHKSAYTITRYRVALSVHAMPNCPSPLPSNWRIIPVAELSTLPMPSPYRRALDAVLKDRVFQLE